MIVFTRMLLGQLLDHWLSPLLEALPRMELLLLAPYFETSSKGYRSRKTESPSRSTDSPSASSATVSRSGT